MNQVGLPAARRLADAAWPEVPERPLVLVPVGSIEQHGPHLPLDTDSAIATAVANSAAELIGGPVLVAPVLVYGSSGEHQAFPGTVSIGTPVLTQVVVELVRSLRAWAGRVVFVNAHGGNLTALETAVTQLRDEGHDVAWVPCATEGGDAGGDLHAGYIETSLMLHLRPASVRLDRAEPGNCGSLAELLPAMRVGGVRAVSANGVLGNPTGASAEHGARMLQQMAEEVARRIDQWIDSRMDQAVHG